MCKGAPPVLGCASCVRCLRCFVWVFGLVCGVCVGMSLTMTYFPEGGPQYHRRCLVSRSCSGWEGVGPRRYGRQTRRVCDVCVSGVAVCALGCVWRYGHRIKPIGQLVRLSSTPCGAYTCRLSTWWSATALIGKSHLGVSFALRCFQRLSLPHLATRRCHWRDNRYTRGASTPVLSY